MDGVAKLPAQERGELFSGTATQKGTSPANAGRDRADPRLDPSQTDQGSVSQACDRTP